MPSPAPPPPPLRANTPKQLGMYRITDELGTGGTGTVYKAEHVLLGHLVAIKVLRPELSHDHSYYELFLSEARTANHIESDAVVDVVDIGRADGGLTFLVMELVEGWNLHSLLKRGPLSPFHAVQIARQVCEALVHVHESGFIHRDIKPQNIHVVECGADRQVKLLDFGIAAKIESKRGDIDVQEGVLVGTPEYMAPEQARAGSIDHRCDLYAIGSLLFEMLTRRPPFERKSLEQVILDISFTAPPSPSQLTALPAVVRDDIDHLVDWCLAKEPEHRPANARELAEALLSIEHKLAGDQPVPSLRDTLAPEVPDPRPAEDIVTERTSASACAPTLRSAK